MTSPNWPRIHVERRTGDGVPLLLLHGIGRNGKDFAPLRPWLMHRPTIAWDHRGHGSSDRAERYLAADYATDVVHWLEEQNLGSIDLYGHSLGAIVALRVAAESPQRIRSIVLEDPPSPAFVAALRESVYYYSFVAMRELAGSQDEVETVAARLAATRLGEGPEAPRFSDVRDAASIQFSAQCLRSVDPRVFEPVFAGEWFEGYDFLATARKVTCPALLLYGEVAAGGMLPTADATALQGALRRGVAVKFPAGGHLLHWQRLEETVRYALAFWESL